MGIQSKPLAWGILNGIAFAQENPEATWTAISDKSKIEELQ